MKGRAGGGRERRSKLQIISTIPHHNPQHNRTHTIHTIAPRLFFCAPPHGAPFFPCVGISHRSSIVELITQVSGYLVSNDPIFIQFTFCLGGTIADMTLFSACEHAIAHRQIVERWCICRQCVYGFAIPFEIDEDRGEHRVCGEPCVVGIPRMSADDYDDDDDDGADAIAAAVAVTTVVTAGKSLSAPPLSTPISILRCNICHVEMVDQSSSSTKPCVSDDDDTISADN